MKTPFPFYILPDPPLTPLSQKRERGEGRIGGNKKWKVRKWGAGGMGAAGFLSEELDKYPLNTHKLADYLLFREVVMMMKQGEHLTAEGLQTIINIRATPSRSAPHPPIPSAFPSLSPTLKYIYK